MNVAFEDVIFERGGRRVLEIPSLSFAEGRVTGLIGPNGSGKSTMLRLIAALERPQAGRVLIAGREVKPDAPTRAALAYAFQQPVFLAASLRNNFDLALKLRGVPTAERPGRMRAAAEACGVLPLLNRRALELSGGEAQRANLARALSLHAPVTLLDEPLTGLDAPGRAQLLRELPGLLRRFTSTAILVTHDRQEALLLADDLAVLIGGKLRAHGTKAEVLRNPPDAETAAFLGYSVIATGDGFAAVMPGQLRLGPGEVCFELRAEAVIDLGLGHELHGTIAGTPVAIPMREGEAPRPGSIVPVSARERSVLRFL